MVASIIVSLFGLYYKREEIKTVSVNSRKRRHLSHPQHLKICRLLRSQDQQIKLDIWIKSICTMKFDFLQVFISNVARRFGTDLPPRAVAHSLAELRRAHTQRSTPSKPSFSASRQTALWRKVFLKEAEASTAAGSPRARVHGLCCQRDGKPQKSYPARAC